MATFDSVNPARPSEIVGTYPTMGAPEVDAAVASAEAAQRRWARVPVPARADVIARTGAILAGRKAELAALVSRECGKVLVEAGGDGQETVDMAGFVAGQGPSAWGGTVPSQFGSEPGWTTRAPRGVRGLIT